VQSAEEKREPFKIADLIRLVVKPPNMDGNNGFGKSLDEALSMTLPQLFFLTKREKDGPQEANKHDVYKAYQEDPERNNAAKLAIEANKQRLIAMSQRKGMQS
jgi:hypothetical protein